MTFQVKRLVECTQKGKTSCESTYVELNSGYARLFVRPFVQNNIHFIKIFVETILLLSFWEGG